MYQITVRTAFSHYNDHCKSCGRRETSINLNVYAQTYLQEYLLEQFHNDDVSLDTLDRYVLRSFLLWLQDSKHVSGSTAQRVYDVLNALCNFLVDEELIPKSPMIKVEKPKRKLRPITPLSVEQIQALIDSCDANTFTGVRNKLIIALLFDTGVRATELCMVDLDDVDISEHKILLRHTKNGVPRYTYFNGVVARLLSRYLLIRGEHTSECLIITQAGEATDRHWLWKMISRVGKRAGIKVHPHLLRHSCGVTALKNGSDIATVMRVLGHSNPRMTLHYSQLADTDVQIKHSQTSPADKLNISSKKDRKDKYRE